LSDPSQPRLRAAVLGLLSATALLSLLGTALSPYLLVKNPLLLVAISPAAHHVAMAAATVDPAPLLLVATLRRALVGVASYGLGLLYGRAALGWIEQRQPWLWRLFSWVEKIFTRFGVALLLLAPMPTVAFFAGAARSRFSLVVLALLVGHTLWAAATYYVGDALASRTDLITDFLGEHLLESTLACVGLVTLAQLLKRLRRRPVAS
jgi:membrane protein YqaA with SNARE-associated domain